MNTSNNALKHPLQALKTDFSHRFELSCHDDIHHDIHPTMITNTVDTMVSRAKAIIEILGTQFVSHDSIRISDDGMFYALDSIQRELEDISQFVAAFSEFLEVKSSTESNNNSSAGAI